MFNKKTTRVPRSKQVHLLLQFFVTGGERATFLIRNVAEEFEQQLDVVCVTDKHLHQFYLALLRKAKMPDSRVTWNPDMIEVEGLTKIRTFALRNNISVGVPDLFVSDILF